MLWFVIANKHKWHVMNAEFRIWVSPFCSLRRIISVLLLDDKTCQIYVKHLNVFDNVLKPVEVFTHEVVGSEHAVGNAEFLCQDLLCPSSPEYQSALSHDLAQCCRLWCRQQALKVVFQPGWPRKLGRMPVWRPAMTRCGKGRYHTFQNAAHTKPSDQVP